MDGSDDLPVGGLKGMFSKNRRSRDDSAIPEDASDTGSPRNSTDNVLDKIRSRINVGNEGGNNNNNNNNSTEDKILKFLPGHARRKQKKRRDSAQIAEDDDEDVSRGRSLGDAGAGAGAGTGADDDDAGGSTSRPAARDRLETPDSHSPGDTSSMLTLDDDDGDTYDHRPALHNHQSHIGYLTASSPQIRATAVDSPTIDRAIVSPPSSPLPKASSSTPRGTRAANDAKLATQNDLAISQKSAASSLSVDSEGSGKGSKSRSVSPGTKFKDAFKPSRRSTAPQKANGNNDDRPNTGSSLSNIFSKDKSTSSLSKSPKVPDSPVQDGMSRKNKSATQSVKSIPSIVTTPDTPPPLPTATLGGPPDITNTPPTPVDSSDPKSPRTEQKGRKEPETKAPSTASQNPNVVVSPSGNMISHRRVRSESASTQPSKLSQAMAPPLTPTIEEVKTPGTRNASQTSGFFNSMFSAAQNAANTFTNIGNNSPGRARSATGQSGASDDSKNMKPISEDADEPKEEIAEPIKPLAIDTIGSGDLSLSHLGIASDAQSIGSNGSRSRSSTVVHREEESAREEDIFAARAVSAAYDSTHDAVTPMVEHPDSLATATTPKPSSVNGSQFGEKSPPVSVYEGEGGGILRSGSLRSKVAERARKRRQRNNSSQTTIGAAISATNSALVQPAHKSTGFAVATKKRNRDFHQLFRSVPEDDYLIEDYSAALQRDILLAGRIYISEGHICFSSNILGWVTTLVISFDEIVCVEKENTAMVFPNAIAIQTLHARHTFRSLLNREATYDLMIKIWKISHPALQSSENGVNVSSGTGSKTEKIEHAGSDIGDPGSDDGEIYDEDDESGSEEESDDASEAGTAPRSIPESVTAESPPKTAIPRKPSNVGTAAGQATSQGPTVSESKAAEKAAGAAAAANDFPGPATHAPTECTDKATHYEKVLQDDTIAAPLGKVFSMLFGATSGGFMGRWLVDEQKCWDLTMEDDKKGLGEELKTRSYAYTKPLGGSIGPKQTKCNITEQLDAFDLEKAVSVTLTTQTPDVPSGNVFSVKTRYCLMWGPNNSTRMIICCTIEWTGKSWLKGPIEKGANDGQVQYANDLFKALKAGVSSKPRANGTAKTKKGGKKKKGGDTTKSSSQAAPAQKQGAGWGPLEPLHGILGPVVDILGPLINIYTIGVFVIFFGFFYWRRSGSAGTSLGPGIHPGMNSAQRMVAYEELWRQEEAALWDWLEDRVGGTDGIVFPVGSGGEVGSKTGKSNADQSKTARKARDQAIKGAAQKGMGEKEVKRAIQVTEDKLKVLKDSVKLGGSSAQKRKEKESAKEEGGAGEGRSAPAVEQGAAGGGES